MSSACTRKQAIRCRCGSAGASPQPAYKDMCTYCGVCVHIQIKHGRAIALPRKSYARVHRNIATTCWNARLTSRWAQSMSPAASVTALLPSASAFAPLSSYPIIAPTVRPHAACWSRSCARTGTQPNPVLILQPLASTRYLFGLVGMQPFILAIISPDLDALNSPFS